MSKLMVMGAAVEQLPGIIKAKELGYEVGVIDFNPNAIGIPFADKYYNVSTIDPEGVYEAGKDFGAEGFFTLATDMPMRAVAYANKKLGIQGISEETALKATDKGEMIKAFKAHDVASPWFYIIESEKELEELVSIIKYPCIMKPVDNAASRGVVLISSQSELFDAYEYSKQCSRSGYTILEEYMRGNEVSVEVLVYNGVPNVLAITDKRTSGAPHFVEEGHNQYSKLSDDTQRKIKDLAVNAVKALGIQIGPAHVEIMVTDDGPKVIELGARLGGDCITSHLVYLSTGIDMVKETIKTICGEKPDLTPKYKKGAAIRFLVSSKKGKLVRVDGIENARKEKGIIEVSMIMNPGDEISGNIDSSDDRIAYVIAQDVDPDSAIQDAEKALSLMTVVEE